jgi:prophage DNA circulation protein
MTDFARTLHKASWRGVPFGLDMGTSTVGRRKVRHDYPYRDTVWLEDQGKLPPSFKLQGFLIGNSAIYGGGDVQSQRVKIQAAAEAEGQGILVHPSRGRLNVDLLDLVITERWDEGNYFELLFTFVQGGAQVFPSAAPALRDQVAKAATRADAAGIASFVKKVAGPLKQGVAAATLIKATANQWIHKISGLARDATSLYGTVSQLGGADFGRFFNGRNAGFLAGLVSPYAGAGSVGDLISAGAAQRSRVSSALGLITSTIDRIGVGASAGDVAASVHGGIEALRASVADPADGIRLMSSLAKFSAVLSGPQSAIVDATSDLFRQGAAVALTRVGANYAPSSADDASTARAAVLRPLEAVIRLAGDSGDDDVFSALRGLRKTVVDDLGQRGGALARLTEIQTLQALPSVVIAHEKYGDAARALELVTQAGPVHPWFMPTHLTALAN